MTMKHAERELERFGDNDLAQIQAGLLEAFRKRHSGLTDISLPSVAAPVEKPAVKIPDVLQQAIMELNKTPFSPEAITNFWRTKLQTDSKRIELNISVPDCDWTEEEIRKPMVDINGNEVPSMMIYVPEQFIGKKGLVKLGQTYPKMNSWAVREGTIVQDSPKVNKRGGWIKVEATVDAPNLNTTQKDLEAHAKDKKYLPQRLNVYILASQASKDLKGYYLDEGATWSRLPGSRLEGDVVSAYFHSAGHLYVGWRLGPQGRHPGMGGRFEEVKKT